MATTRSAIVTAYGSPPTLQTVPIPPPSAHEVQIRVLATGQHQIVRSRAAGTHFSSGPLPHTVGVDGTGIILSLPPSNPTSTSPTTKTNFSIGQPVYFLTFKTGGSFSTTLNVPMDSVFPLPETADPIQVAALLNPAMSSWMALRARTSGLQDKKFTVVIMGVTSASGSIAIELCRHLGAGKIIGIARNATKLAELELDVAIQLQPKVEDTDYSALKGCEVDVILDYVYAAPMAHFLGCLKQRGMVQYVQIGSLGGGWRWSCRVRC